MEWKKLAGTLGALILLLTGSVGAKEKGEDLYTKKKSSFYFFLTLYATSKYECALKQELLKKTINCIDNSRSEEDLRTCINNFKTGMEKIGKSVELYGKEFMKRLLEQERRKGND